MKSRFLKAVAVLVPPLMVVPPQAVLAAEPHRNPVPLFVAGLVPSQRPASVPAIREFIPSADWRKQSLSGVSKPIPASLGFLDQQGAWYTPFNHPGMTGYYDLRNWHPRNGESTKTSK